MLIRQEPTILTSARLPISTRDAVGEFAKAHGVTLSKAIIHILGEHVKQWQESNAKTTRKREK
jgi:hypothetical protein